MPLLISLLRGINVGGHHKIPMAALRDLYTALKFEDPRSYVQSGNVVFRTRDRHLDNVAERIESAIEEQFGFRPSVVLRTAEEWKGVIERNPFANRSGLDPAKLAVMVLKGEAPDNAAASIASMKLAPEDAFLLGRELYVYFPEGMGRTKFPFAAVDRILKTPVTARNWNTVLQIEAMLNGPPGKG